MIWSKYRTEIWEIGILRAPIAAVAANPRLAEIPVTWLPRQADFTFIADPFGLWRDGLLYVFCEFYDYRTKRGTIRYFTYDAAFAQVGEGDLGETPAANRLADAADAGGRSGRRLGGGERGRQGDRGASRDCAKSELLQGGTTGDRGHLTATLATRWKPNNLNCGPRAGHGLQRINRSRGAGLPPFQRGRRPAAGGSSDLKHRNPFGGPSSAEPEESE